jgi:DNA-binding response OmpR family regulator
VLVVEDAEAIRAAVGITLEHPGCAVLARADGDNLERDLAGFHPDLVVLDVMLPGRDGFALLQVVRETSDAGIVLLTARDSVEDRLRGLRTGADHYVVKPFVLAEGAAFGDPLAGACHVTDPVQPPPCRQRSDGHLQQIHRPRGLVRQ